MFVDEHPDGINYGALHFQIIPNATGNPPMWNDCPASYHNGACGFCFADDRHLDAVLDAFKAGKQPPVHARAGRRALQLAFAAIKSFETGKKVSMPVDSFAMAAAPAILPPPPNP